MLTIMCAGIITKIAAELVKEFQPKGNWELLRYEWLEEPVEIDKVVWTGTSFGVLPIHMDRWHGWAFFAQGDKVRTVNFYESSNPYLQFSGVIPNVTRTAPACIILSPEIRDYTEEALHTVLFHEFGHIVNGDLDSRGNPNYGKREYWRELAADKFAADTIGLDTFVRGMKCIAKKEFGGYFTSFSVKAETRESATRVMSEIARRINDLGSDEYNEVFYDVVRPKNELYPELDIEDCLDIQF